MSSQLQRLTAPENNLLEQVADARARIERLERYPDTLDFMGARSDESFVVIGFSGYLTNERRLQAGDGLTLTDGGANADVTIAMGTPSTLSVLTENIVTGDTHWHAVETSSNPGATQVILATAEDGGVQLLRLGIGTDPDTDNAVKVVNGAWIGAGAAAGRVVINTTPDPDQVQILAADLYLATGLGVVHADGVDAGKVLQADGTRYVPADPTGSLPFAPTARGDMIAADATPAWARLAFPGAAGYALVTTATDPSWSLIPTWLGMHTFSAGLSLVEMAPPAPPAAANTAHIYAEESHGFTLLSFMDDTGMVRKIVRDSVIIVKNVTGGAISKNRAVYATGSEDGVPTIDYACADDPATMPAIGITIEGLANGDFGRVIQAGLLDNVDTSAFTAGDVLYISAVTPGAPTLNIPPTPSMKQELGTVLVESPPATSTGSIQVIARSTLQNETGTRQNTWRVGDAVAGAKSITFLANFTGTLQWTPTAARVITLPDLTGTVALGAGTLTIATANDVTVPNHTHAITLPDGFTGFAIPSLTLGIGNVEGVASTAIRSDATICIFDINNPTTIEPDDAGAVGTAHSAARRDHEHGIVCAAPGANLSVSTTNAEGVATSFARSDHSHAITSSSNPGVAASILATNAGGEVDITGHVAIGDSATVSVTDALQVYEDFTDTTGLLTAVIGIAEAEPAANFTSNFRGVIGIAYLNAAQTQTNGYFWGVCGISQIIDTIAGTAYGMIGVKGYVDVEDGAATEGYGGSFDTPRVDTGSLTTGAGVRIVAGTVGAGSIGTLTGLYIENITAGNTNYSIYSAGGAGYHAGDFDIGGNLDVTGTITDGGSDPPYLLFDAETRASVVERVRQNVPTEKLSGAILFYNTDAGRMEMWTPMTGEYRDLAGSVVHVDTPLMKTFAAVTKYALNRTTGEIEGKIFADVARAYVLRDDCELDRDTGVIYRVKRDDKDGTAHRTDEMVPPEEAIIVKGKIS